MNINDYLYPNRKGEGLKAFVDFPQSILHLKANETDGQYFLMYFSEDEKELFKASCENEDVITIYDNSYFEYKLQNMTPDMEAYADNAKKYKPNIVMADIQFDAYQPEWTQEMSHKLIDQHDITKLMVIPHADNIDDMSAIIRELDHDENVDVIGLCYQYDGFTRMELIAHCLAKGCWCWNKPVHLLGLSEANEIYQHRDLIRICQNIKSIDSSFPTLLGSIGEDLFVDKNGSFSIEKPTFNILNVPECNPYLIDTVVNNINVFKSNIENITSGYAKIALVGAAGTGKTTESEYLKNILPDTIYVKYPPIHNVCDYRDPDKANLATSLYTGCNLMAAWMQYNQTAILDRCLIDNIVYAISNQNEFQVDIFKALFKEYCKSISSIVWVYPLEGVDIENDGKRIADKDVQSKMHDIFSNVIDDIIKDNPDKKIIKLPGDQTIEERAESLLRAI